MKIVFCSSFYVPHRGGVEKHVSRVAEELVKRGHTVTILTCGDDLDFALNGLSVLHMPESFREDKQKTWQWLANHRSVLSEADVIQIHDVTWWFWPSWWRYKRSLYITFHGWETKWPIPFSAKLQRRVASWVVRGTMHVGSWIEDYYGDIPNIVTYGGTDVASSRCDFHQRKCVFVGRLAADNQVSWYAQFFQELRKLDSSWQMTWVGDGELRGMAEAVGTVTGMLDNPEDAVKHATVVCANSYLSMLDAQASGRLVVAATAHPLKKAYVAAYPGNKWLVHGTSPFTVAHDVMKLLRAPKKLQHQLDDAKAWAHSQTWSKVTDEYETLWH